MAINSGPRHLLWVYVHIAFQKRTISKVMKLSITTFLVALFISVLCAHWHCHTCTVSFKTSCTKHSRLLINEYFEVLEYYLKLGWTGLHTFVLMISLLWHCRKKQPGNVQNVTARYSVLCAFQMISLDGSWHHDNQSQDDIWLFSTHRYLDWILSDIRKDFQICMNEKIWMHFS